MTELDKIEELLWMTGTTYVRRPLFDAMPRALEQIAACDMRGERIWNVIEAEDGLLEYSGPEGAKFGVTAEYLIGAGLVW